MKNAERVITVRMPKELKEAIDEKIKEERVSMNQYVNKLLADDVSLDISTVRFSGRKPKGVKSMENIQEDGLYAKDSEKM